MHPQGGSSSHDLTFHVCGVESTKEKASWAEERINNKLPGCEPRSHWKKASALITAPPLLDFSQMCTQMIIRWEHLKMESISKLSNLNFQWAKTLYQKSLNNVAIFFTFFKGYRCRCNKKNSYESPRKQMSNFTK